MKLKEEQEYISYILNTLTERELLEQLAEEASELAQAALKLIRAAKLSNNPTPSTKENAVNNLVEEFYDVYNLWYLLWRRDDFISDRDDRYLTDGLEFNKLKRWVKRLRCEEN